MKNFYTLLFVSLLAFSTSNILAQIGPCSLSGASNYIDFTTSSTIMIQVSVNGISQYTYEWNDGTPVGSSSQKPFYSGWCVTITDTMSGCDTTICESCIPTGGVGICNMILAPVCGCDGNIYSNDCIAMNNGIFTFTSAIGPNGQTLPCAVPLPSWDCINDVCIDPNSGNGQYPTQLDCILDSCGTTPNPSWDCINGACIDPLTGNGQYPTQLDCILDSCSVVNPTWECINGACIDPLTGQGTYTNYNNCVANCVTPTWDCVGNACVDPGTGGGIYPTQTACLVVCGVTPSWNCISPGNCIDPGTGTGIYTTLAACSTACAATSVSIDEEISSLLIYPNPAKNILTIDGNYTSATIYTVFGRVVLTTDYQKTIDVAALSSGIYFIRINTNNVSAVKNITIAK